ncbi:hypothetical protein GCM10010168_53700 [Actinoplanes ianthinogenes]|uniref:Uncharacterized protein n=1 Tax=Actinoplanes ianthinogenes TaxID=122358 RepID=A0ABN6C896_9ACTN|nr:hypothetical protein [Actinoplanes ianthinogenes]BCJ41632.1 hypothetical protein Aiant_22890 [Actinoplanes ianthinogenes]GGR28777.1 hypothetical protein GCM10010168_53700 [Actinoplanes ianthinogenes]
MNAALLYLVIAGLSLGLALHSLKQALAPLREIIRAATAIAVVGFSVGAAVVLIIAAALAW